MCCPATNTMPLACSPASAALDSFLASSSPISGSNKRAKRSTMDSPQASFAFDMSELFNLAATSEEESVAFPSIEWSFDDDSSSSGDDETAALSSFCAENSSGMLSSMSDSSLLGKRTRSTEGAGLGRSKTLRGSIDLLG